MDPYFTLIGFTISQLLIKLFLSNNINTYIIDIYVIIYIKFNS
jgi:hypothetical protein